MDRVSVPTPLRLAAVVLTGGTGVRMGGVDKAALEVGGTPLLEHALAATAAADETVVVGGQVATSRPVLWTVEDPPHGGPAAGLLAGVDRLTQTPDLVAVLAVDMPHVHEGTFARLLAALGVGGPPEGQLERQLDGLDGAVLVDAQGLRQTLAGVYRHGALSAARRGMPRDVHGLSMRRLVGRLRLAEVPGLADETRDVDTWQDLVDLDGLPDRAPRTTLER